MVCIKCSIPLRFQQIPQPKTVPICQKHCEKNRFKVQQRSCHSPDRAISPQRASETHALSISKESQNEKENSLKKRDSLLLLLSHFSRVRLCVTPQTAAHQAPQSLRFSRQEYWSGLPFPSPMHERESEVAQSCLTLSDPTDCSPPGSPVPGIFQERVLEWGAIAFSVRFSATSAQTL